MSTTWLLALAGGAMIGAASALLLLTHGQIAGVSGITSALLQRTTPDRAWRLAFVGGLLAAGLVAQEVAPASLGRGTPALPVVAIAGALVGFGTRLGSGCTSGHGICGLARLSVRSLVAVMTFLATGAVTATLVGALS